MDTPYDRPRRLAAEAVGTALLLAVVVGSGIMGQRLAGGSVGLALLANSTATGCALAVLILIFAPVSGAHFNPVVSAIAAAEGRLAPREALAFAMVQVAGAVAGVVMAHAMFGLPPLTPSATVRADAGLVFAEGVATFGLIATIAGCARAAPAATPYAVALYIAAAYWFTASTSFANPAVTIARALTDTFAGIRPADAPAFIAAQAAGGAAAALFSRWLWWPAAAPRDAAAPTRSERRPT